MPDEAEKCRPPEMTGDPLAVLRGLRVDAAGLKVAGCARTVRWCRPRYFASLTSITTYTLHFGQCTFTGLRDLDRLASRFPMYTHSWLQRWQDTRQQEYTPTESQMMVFKGSRGGYESNTWLGICQTEGMRKIKSSGIVQHGHQHNDSWLRNLLGTVHHCNGLFMR